MFSKWQNIDIVYQKHLDENNITDINLFTVNTNGIYDHDIIPTQTCDVICCCRHDICYEADDYCKNLNKAAGNAVQLHRYIIYRKGSHFTIQFRPRWGWGCEIEYEYHTMTDCLKHIVLNSATYNDTELGFKLELYNANGYQENTINIRNKAELKRMIQNNYI